MSQVSWPQTFSGWLGIATMVVMSQACSPQQQSIERPSTTPAPAAQPAQPASTAADPAVYRGAALAQQVCVRCHDIGISGASPTIPIGAPDFISIASQDGMTASHLQQWMRSSHPSMPSYLFNDSTVDDVASYIMSLRRSK
jgi:cytochrome c